MKNFRRLFSCTLLSCALLSCLMTAPLFAGEAKPAGVASPGIPGIAPAMKPFIKAGQISGVVTLVGQNGKIVALDAVGQADVAGDVAMRTDHLFSIASMTKPITATAFMILWDEGKLKLDDPVSKYIPEFKTITFNGKPLDREITLQDLLTHTSGVHGSQQNVGTLEKTAIEVAGRGVQFQPGTKWQYSPGLTVCGRVIEVASGQPFAKFLTERIFQPLGMKDTTFNPTEAQAKRLVKLYQPGKEKGTIEETKHWINAVSATRPPNPSGGLFSTAVDLFRFYQMVLNGGELNGKRIVSKKAVKTMTSIHTGDLEAGFAPGHGWGLGWGVVSKPEGVTGMVSPGTYGHGGAFGTQGWVDPKTKTIYVLLIQRTGFGNSDGSSIRQTFQQTAVDGLQKTGR